MQCNSNETNLTIPPNLLKNFNAFNILEPKKNSDATKVDKLVDIDDSSQDSGFHDLNAAFFDKSRDFDLVDLFQNMFVTPQHIKKKENEVNVSVTASKALDSEFKHFFDVLESGQKTDWANIEKLKEEDVSKHEYEHYIEEQPRVLVPKVFLEDSDPEDIIEEVLAQKTLEKRVLGETSYSSTSKAKIQSPIDTKKPDLSKVTLNNHEKSDLPKATINHEKIKNPEVIPEFYYSLINNITKDSKFESGSNEYVPRPSEVKTRIDSQINNSLTNFTVKAIQKDEKIYRKKCLLKPEDVKANYTKGPDFNEKSVVLPQIMARINARLAYLDEKENQKRRLILDTSTNPECSTSRFTHQEKKENMEVETSNKKETNTKGVQANMGCNPIRKEAQISMNQQTKTIAVHTTDRTCLNCSRSTTSDRNPTTSSGKNNTDYGKLSPTVLMEDCNRERLRALKQSQMFKDFVYKGKYEL